MTSITPITRREQDGIEFYVWNETGETGISIRGLARLCGVSAMAIVYLVNKCIKKEPPKFLKAYADKRLDFFECVKNLPRGGHARILISDFCIEVIGYYAKKGKQEAIYTSGQFMKIGFNQWIYSLTGYNPNSESKVITPEVVTPTKKEIVEERELLREAEKIKTKIKEKEAEIEKLREKLTKVNTVIRLIQQLELD